MRGMFGKRTRKICEKYDEQPT